VRGWLRYERPDGTLQKLGPKDTLDVESVKALVRRGFFGHPERKL